MGLVYRLQAVFQGPAAFLILLQLIEHSDHRRFALGTISLGLFGQPLAVGIVLPKPGDTAAHGEPQQQRKRRKAPVHGRHYKTSRARL